MAEAANQQGNKFYKEGNFAQAAICFQKASDLDRKEPKYMSNLSAVLYETGSYISAIEATYLAWERLRERHGEIPVLDPLALKLATRIAKVKINGQANNTISLHHEPSIDATKKEKQELFETYIRSFVTADRPDQEDAKVKEMNSAWDHWRTIREGCSQHSAEKHDAIHSAARTCLRAIPILKSAPDPTLEYFTFGHDKVRSLLHGLNEDMEDDHWLENGDQLDWSFLFGGSGDGRHVFGTLIHLYDMGTTSGNALKVHMTLVDIHPASLARIIIVLALLRQILHSRLTRNSERSLELYSTLFYTYTSYIMPDYCHQILMETAKSLLEDLPRGVHGLSKCLYINPESIPGVLDVLRYWSMPLKKTTKIFLKRNAANRANYEGMQDELATMMGVQDYRRILESQSRQGWSRRMPDIGPDDAYDDPEAEASIYKRTKVLLPPKALLKRHPALAELVKNYKFAPDNLYENLRREVEKNWQPNPTLFNAVICRIAEDILVHRRTDPFDSFNTYLEVAMLFGRRQSSFCQGTTGFEVTTRFFELVVDAIWELKNNLRIEIVVSDAIAGTSKLLAGDLGHRPEDFPCKYSRIWLSNVPDYTHGFLNTAVHLVPHLQAGQLVVSNNLLNTGSFSNIGHFCYNYTILLPRDVPRILGCEVINSQQSTWQDLALKQLPLPRTLNQLASKNELHTWLAQLLLCILCNGIPQPPPFRVDLPSNLNAFFHVLVHLHRVGFPSHWIGDFVQSMVSDNLVTTARQYLGRLPIPLSEADKSPQTSHRVYLSAWKADLQVILATTKAALPFSVISPPDYPTADDIRVYAAIVRPLDIEKHPLYGFWAPLASPYSRVLSLMLYQPHKKLDAEALAHRVSLILDGDDEVKAVNVQIITSQEDVDLTKGQVSWKMSRSWYEKMKVENWEMAVYRTDLTVAVTKPFAIRECKEILK